MRTLVIFLLFFLSCPVAPLLAAVPPDAMCRAPTADKVREALTDIDAVPRVVAYPSSSIAPAGADYSVGLGRPFQPGKDKAVAFYRVLMDVEAAPKLADRTAIFARELSEDAWQRKAKTLQQGATELLIDLPSLNGWGIHSAIFTIVACTDDRSPLFVSSFQSRVSDGVTFYLLCTLIVSVLYLSIGYWCRKVEEPIKAGGRPIGWQAYLDPVVISSGPNGKGSISRFQVLIFSFIVFSILLNSFFRLGSLSDMSTTVLMLLGISAFGAAASKVTDNTKSRLSWENWVWLINDGWLPKNGLAAITRAKWADLITAEDGVDVYHVQMLIFSLVVAVALMMTGIYGLATFKIPETLLALLGLSQVVYLGGKIVAPPSCAELDAGLTKLQQLQNAYLAKTADPNKKPKTLKDAESDLDYLSFERQYQTVISMFENVIGPRFNNARLSPPFR